MLHAELNRAVSRRGYDKLISTGVSELAINLTAPPSRKLDV